MIQPVVQTTGFKNKNDTMSQILFKEICLFIIREKNCLMASLEDGETPFGETSL